MPAPFVNWSGTVTSRPSAWARPRTEEEVAALVREVRGRGGRLKVCGARHSWSSIAAGDDLQVELGGLAEVIEIDRRAMRVRAGAGCPLHVLLDALAAEGLAMPVIGSVAEQTLAGLTATATHGSSLRVGNISSLVEGMRMVSGAGEIVELGADDPRLEGARVHLGALGVLTEVTLRLREAFRLEERRFVLPFDEAAARIRELGEAHAFAKLWWLPHTESALVFTYDETDAPGERDARAWAVDAWINRNLFPALLRLGKAFPSLIPRTNRSVARVHFRPSIRRGRSDHMLQLVMPPPHRETEIAVDLADTEALLRGTREVAHRDGARVDFVVELRFVKGDGGWMSPAYGRDSCQLVIGGAYSPDIDRVFDGFRRLGQGLGARPHWGKELAITPAEVDALYPRAGEFRALARALDPDGVLRNPFLDAILGPSPG